MDEEVPKAGGGFEKVWGYWWKKLNMTCQCALTPQKAKACPKTRKILVSIYVDSYIQNLAQFQKESFQKTYC